MELVESISYVIANVQSLDEMFGTRASVILTPMVLNKLINNEYEEPDFDEIKDERTRLLVDTIWVAMWHLLDNSRIEIK